MFDCSDIDHTLSDESRDPRLNRRFLRCIPGPNYLGTVLLVGVVHDHPASVFRVAHLVEAFRPDSLAVELPPLALPLFEMYAADQYTPPRLGGEMSVAIQTADDVPVVGIDAPNRGSPRLLIKQLVSNRPSKTVLKTVLRDAVTGLGHALVCRLGAVVGRVTPLRLRLYSHIEYDCSLLDSPAVQADHEETHVSQRQAFLRAIETPVAVQHIDNAREAGMVNRLNELRTKGDVIAVVGIEHLDALDSQLRKLP